jgi:hypothetical protein
VTAEAARARSMKKPANPSESTRRGGNRQIVA